MEIKHISPLFRIDIMAYCLAYLASVPYSCLYKPVDDRLYQGSYVGYDNDIFVRNYIIQFICFNLFQFVLIVIFKFVPLYFILLNSFAFINYFIIKCDWNTSKLHKVHSVLLNKIK